MRFLGAFCDWGGKFIRSYLLILKLIPENKRRMNVTINSVFKPTMNLVKILYKKMKSLPFQQQILS